MMDTFSDRLRKTAGDMSERLGEAARSARERISEMSEVARLNTQIRLRKREKERCNTTMADLLIRMFDQNTFAEALLRPEYLRIREIDEEVVQLEQERDQVAARAGVPLPAEQEALEIPEQPKDLEEPDEEIVLLPEPPAAPPTREKLPPDITAEE